MNNVYCKVCDSETIGPISTYTAEESASHICTPERNFPRYTKLTKVLTNLWPEGYCKIYRCKKCGFGFGVPFVGGNEAYYEILHEQKGYPSWKWDYQAAMEELKLIKVNKVLDIGAGSGYFLRGLDKSISKIALESTEKMIKELGKNKINSYKTFDEIRTNEGDNFDIVTMFQVLEHIAEFREVLGSAKQLLKEGGKIIITVPDADSMFKQEKLIEHPDMPPNHINKWTPESLKIALNEIGFKTEKVIFELGSFRNVKSKLHMRALALAKKKNPIIVGIYKVNSKRFRSLLLSLIAPFIFLSLIHELKYLKEGGAFFLIAEKT